MNSNELLKDIIEIKTPEEAIERLKEKWKNVLASKIEQVISWINWEAEFKWKKLKENLPTNSSDELINILKKDSPSIQQKLNWIIEKKEVEQKISQLENVVSKWWLAAWATVLTNEFYSWIESIKKEEWLSKIDKIFWFFDNMKNSIASFFGWLSSWFANKFPFIAKFFWIEWTNKNKDWQVVKWEEKENKEKTSQEANEEQIEEYKNQMTSKLENQFNKKFNPEEKSKLHELIEKYKNDLSPLTKNTAEWNIVFVDLGFQTWKIALFFLFDLVKEWIIPASSIAMNLVDTWINTIKIWIAPIWKLLWINDSEIVLWELSMDTFWQMELSDTQKQVLLWIIYRKWWMITNLMWQASYVLSRLLITPFEMWENISSLSMTSNTLLWNYEKVAKNYDKMLKILWAPEDELSKILYSTIKETKVKTEVLGIYNKFGWDIKKFEQEIMKLWYESDFIKEVRNELKTWKIKNESELWVKLSNLVKTNAKNTQDAFAAFKWKISTTIKWPFWDKRFLLDEFTSKLWNVNDWIEKSFKSWRTIFKYADNFKNSFKMIDMPKSFEKTVFALTKENSKDFIKQLKFLATQSPELVRWIFSHLPIIAVAWVAATSEEPFFKELTDWLKFLIPIVWPFLIMKEARLENWQPHDIVNLALWWWFLVFDWYTLVKAVKLAKEWEIPTTVIKFFWKPVVDIARLWKWTLQTILYTEHWFKAIYELIKAWKIAEASNLINYWKLKQYWLIIWILAIIWWWAKEYFSKKPEEIIAKLEKDWFLNKDWWFNIAKISEAYQKINNSEKKAILWYLISSILNENSVSKDNLNRNFSVEIKSWNKVYITFKDLASVQERELIKNNLNQIWIEPSFGYESWVLINYAKELKKSNKNFEEFNIVASWLWIDNSRRFWDDA